MVSASDPASPPNRCPSWHRFSARPGTRPLRCWPLPRAWSAERARCDERDDAREERGDGDDARRSWVKQSFRSSRRPGGRTGGAHAAGAGGQSRIRFSPARHESRSNVRGAARRGPRNRRFSLLISRFERRPSVERARLERGMGAQLRIPAAGGEIGVGFRRADLARPRLRSAPGGAATSSETAARPADWRPVPRPSGCRRWCRR